ncbi:hypothetical protein HanOQP8_Chr02g0052861 [Helianthus annuus]|nr:hypothetical protein HanOQP8_Chr02g0052861 [Helianthus annuus]
MFGYVGWKFRGEGRVDREVCWDYAKCAGVYVAGLKLAGVSGS